MLNTYRNWSVSNCPYENGSDEDESSICVIVTSSDVIYISIISYRIASVRQHTLAKHNARFKRLNEILVLRGVWERKKATWFVENIYMLLVYNILKIIELFNTLWWRTGIFLQYSCSEAKTMRRQTTCAPSTYSTVRVRESNVMKNFVRGIQF